MIFFVTDFAISNNHWLWFGFRFGFLGAGGVATMTHGRCHRMSFVRLTTAANRQDKQRSSGQTHTGGTVIPPGESGESIDSVSCSAPRQVSLDHK